MRAVAVRAMRIDGEVSFELTVEVGLETEASPETLQVQLAQHDQIAITWVATFPVTRQGSADVWSGPLPWPQEDAPELLSVSQILYSPEEPGSPEMSVAAQHLPPASPKAIPIAHQLALAKSDTADEWITGSEADDRVVAMSSSREAAFDIELTAPGAASNSPNWVVVVLVDQVLLTVSARLPGIQLLPLASGIGGRPEIALMNVLLPEVGFNSGLGEGGQQPSPKAIAILPSVIASTFEEAVHFGVVQAQQAFDIIGLNRHAAPRLVAAAVGSRQTNGTITTVNGTSLVPGYSGNLIGGFISGEDPHHLLKQWDATRLDPRVSLWLRLHNEGSADQRWDYRVFRSFNLLEGIGREVFRARTPVVDEDGEARLQSNGQPYTSDYARGVVALVLGRCAAPAPSASGGEIPSTARRGNAIPDSFWQQLELWVAVRNRVAHAGSWAYPPGARPPSSWSKLDAGLRQPGSIDELVRGTRDTVQHVLHTALAGKL